LSFKACFLNFIYTIEIQCIPVLAVHVLLVYIHVCVRWIELFDEWFEWFWVNCIKLL